MPNDTDRARERVRHGLGRRAEDELDTLLQDETDSPRGEDRLDGAGVEKLDDTPLQHDAEEGADYWSKEHPGPEATAQVARCDERIGADREELAVRHIDDAHQPEDDRQPEGNQDQNRDQANAVEQLCNERGRRHRSPPPGTSAPTGLQHHRLLRVHNTFPVAMLHVASIFRQVGSAGRSSRTGPYC